MKKTFLLVLFGLLATSYSWGQARVTGTVIGGDDKKPLSFVTVLVDGTAVVVNTDLDGKYSITVPAGSNTLVFSLMGYETIKEKVGGRSVIDISLAPDATLLTDAVVTAMGIQRSDRSMGYSVAKVDAAEASLKAEPDPLRSLQGKIAGVQINATTGVAGSATRMTIRGNTSFTGGNEPLYVVDGIPYSNATPEFSYNSSLGGGTSYGSGLNTLDPNDIESMSVLKGAAAAALYGSRAANGVVLITTKSGSKKKRPSQQGFEVVLTGSYAVEQVSSLPDYQNTFGAGFDFQASNSSNGSYGAPFSEVSEIPTWGTYAKAFPDLFGKTVPYRAYKNNVRDLFNTGGVYDMSLSMSSNNDKGNFTTTVSRLKQDSYIPNSKFERYAISAGGNQKLDNGLRIGGNVSYSNSFQSGPPMGVWDNTNSFARTLFLARNWDVKNMPSTDRLGNSLFFLTGVLNPLWAWDNNFTNTTSERTVANFSTGLNIVSWLQADYQFGVNQFKLDRKQVTNLGTPGSNGLIQDQQYSVEEMESNFTLTATKNFAKDFTLKAVVGHNFNIQKKRNSRQQGNEMILRGIYNVDNTIKQQALTSLSDRRLWALFADASLSYKNYLFLNLTGRNDFSSTLPSDNKSFFYPAATLSFIFTDAIDAIQNDVLTMGRVRLGWGKVGNDAPPYYVSGYFDQGVSFAGMSTLYRSGDMFDPNLSPEFTTEYEVGTELKFFGDRGSLDITYYHRETTDQIAQIQLPRSTGYVNYYTNFGKLRNRGVEVAIGATPVKLANSFRWDVNMVYTLNRSMVMELTEGIDNIELNTWLTGIAKSMLIKGQPYGVLVGTCLMRDTDGTLLVNPATGAYMKATEEKILGDPNPKYLLGLTNRISYKGVSLGINFDCSVGGSLYTETIRDMMGRGVTKDTEDRYGTRILPGVYADSKGNVMRDANGQRIQNTVQMSEANLWFANGGAPTLGLNSVNEVAVYNATVFRLNEIEIGWDIPSKWLKKTKIGSANLSVVGRNLWFYAPYFPKHIKFDPSVTSFGSGNIQGIEMSAAPTVRRFAVNLRLTF